MKLPKISIALKNFDAGKYESSDVGAQIKAGWYDWFCRDASLKNKTYKLMPKVRQLAELLGKDFMDKNYVFFKNNCPMSGTLYDDFRFCNLKTGDVVYTIIPSSGHTVEKGEAQIWARENDFKEPLVKGKWSDVVNYFKEKSK